MIDNRVSKAKPAEFFGITKALRRYRHLAAPLSIALAVGCAGLATFSAIRNSSGTAEETVYFKPNVEVDMLVSRGTTVQLFLNDWQQPPHNLAVVTDQRHIYRFTDLPRELKQLRLDPTDRPDASFVIYSIAVKDGSRILQQFGPAEMKKWHFINISPPQDENGGLLMADTTDDPIMWTPMALHLVESQAAEPPSSAARLYFFLRRYVVAFAWAILTLLLGILASKTAGWAPGTTEAASPAQTRLRRILELLLTAAAVVLALWILITTINVARWGWSAIPAADDWDRWITFARYHYSLEWFFLQHVDHRLAAPKLLFAVDQSVFHGRGWFALLCSFCFQALTGIMLWRLSARAYRQDRMERTLLAAVICACIFSGQQWINFIWPLQMVFPMVYCAAAAALVALWKSAEPDQRAGGRWIAVSIALAAVATYTMANGVLVWFVLVLAAVWLRIPRRWLAWIGAGLVLLGATYFYHWHKANPYPPLPPSERLPHAIIFWLAHLGSPVAPLTIQQTEASRLAWAAIPGALLGAVLLIRFAMLWRRRERFNNAYAVLVFYCVFIVGTSATISYGRSEGSLMEAFSQRYLTPSYILWACMLLVVWPPLRRVNRVALYSILCAAMLGGIAIHQRAILNIVRDRASMERLGTLAVVDNVIDPQAWTWLYYAPSIAMDAIDYLRNNDLSVFTEEWTHWPGIPLDRRFSIDRNPGACQGQFEQVVAVPSALRPGWRVTGWAWDIKAGRSPRYVVLADDGGQIAAVALTGFPLPPALAVLPTRYVASTWTGYIGGKPRPITAYLVEADDRSLCAIGTQKIHSGTEAMFKELGDLLPVSDPQIDGGFVPNGFYKGLAIPGLPPVDGLVFGSFPDGNTGSIVLGPFHLDGHTEIAMPLVTGPDSHGLSIVVRDADSKEVLAQMDPLPVRPAWWAWRPQLPSGKEISVEVLAQDKGSAWGEWMAIGWPHVIRP